MLKKYQNTKNTQKSNEAGDREEVGELGWLILTSPKALSFFAVVFLRFFTCTKPKTMVKPTRRGYWPSTFPLRDQSVCVKSYNKTRIAFIFWQKGGPPGLSRCFCALTYGGAFVSPTHMGCGVVRLDACDGGQDLRSPKILTIPIFVWMWTTTCMIWDPKSILGLTNISLIRVLFSVPKKHPDQAHFGQKSSLAWCLCFRVYYALWPKPAWFWPNLVW